MRQNSLWAIGLLPVILSCSVASPPSDTGHLAAHLNAVRDRKWLPDDEYRNIQKEYLAWIDSRVKAGISAQSMNRELRSVGLFPRRPKGQEPEDSLDEMHSSHTGYLDPIVPKPVRSGNDFFVVTAGIYKGSGCSLDVTAIVYQSRPLKRLAYLNADPAESEYAFYLSGLDVGGKDSTGVRVVASGWVASNCTSTWNGKRIRIDRLTGSVVEPILTRDLNAQDSDEGESVAARVERDFVTFRYKGAVGDGDLLSGPAVARYRIVGSQAVLASPVALTRAGFIHEWLLMPEAEAAKWSEPEAVAMRSSVAAPIEAHGFEWARIGRCGGSPPVWEIGLRPQESKVLHVFRISGSRATELRMLAVSDTATLSCVAEDISKGLMSVAAELPW